MKLKSKKCNVVVDQEEDIDALLKFCRGLKIRFKVTSFEILNLK